MELKLLEGILQVTNKKQVRHISQKKENTNPFCSINLFIPNNLLGAPIGNILLNHIRLTHNNFNSVNVTIEFYQPRSASIVLTQ